MAENPSERGKNDRGPLGFRIIGAMKLTSGLLMFAAWFGMFHLFKNNVTEELDWAARHLRLDPEGYYFHKVFDLVTGLDRKHLRAIEAATFFYALLHVVEGIGLILEKDWAGYLTVIATSALVPFEGYEVITKVNGLKIFVLLVNIGFVIYVVIKLRQERRERAARRGESIEPGVSSPQASREPS